MVSVPEGQTTLAEIWPDFIDWKGRRAGERGFLARTLRAHGCKAVLDAALGDGCDSTHLLLDGFEVTSNEIDEAYVRQALLNAHRLGVRLRITRWDWRDFAHHFAANSFDAVMLLGNSLTFLFRKKDRLAALGGFHHVLRPGGILVIDERNYQYLLDHPAQALRHFRYSGRYVYCGAKVKAVPERIGPRKVVFGYRHENGLYGRLALYPFRKGELFGHLEEAGFSGIRTYSDYRPGYNYDADFHQYVAVK